VFKMFKGNFVLKSGCVREEGGICCLVLVVALRPQTPKRIRGGWSHFADTGEPVGFKIWSLSNPGFEPGTFRSLAQRAYHLR
jgi:hypothetical protein